MSLNHVLSMLALAGCGGQAGCPPATRVTPSETPPAAENPYHRLKQILAPWGTLSWHPGQNPQGSVIILLPELHYEPDDTGKDRGEHGRLHRELFEVERTLIERGHTHQLLHEGNSIQRIQEYAASRGLTAEEYLEKLEKDPQEQKTFEKEMFYPYTPAFGKILKVAFTEGWNHERRYEELKNFIGHTPAHELITAVYGEWPGINLSGIDEADTSPILDFMRLHNAIANGEGEIPLSTGEKVSFAELRSRAQKKDPESMFYYCRLRTSYQEARVKHDTARRERERLWAKRLLATSEGLIVMTLGGSHVEQMKSDLLPQTSAVGIFEGNAFQPTLNAAGFTGEYSFTPQGDNTRADNVWMRELPDLVLITRDHTREGCADFLRRLEEK